VDSPTAVRTYEGHTSPVSAVCVLNARQFVSGSLDKTLKLWNVDSSAAVRTYIGHTNSVDAVCMLNVERLAVCVWFSRS